MGRSGTLTGANSQHGVILVEAKSHPSGLRGKCAATEPSLAKVKAAFGATHLILRFDDRVGPRLDRALPPVCESPGPPLLPESVGSSPSTSPADTDITGYRRL